jgi:hypothetical protein
VKSTALPEENGQLDDEPFPFITQLILVPNVTLSPVVKPVIVYNNEQVLGNKPPV